MKRYIPLLAAAFFWLFALPHITASAAARGELAAGSQNVAVTLTIPEGKTEAITALHFRLLVTSGGQMDEPTFRFASSIPSSVKDVSVSRLDSGSYAVDIILSGKKNQDIFPDSERAAIGTLSLHPVSGSYRAFVEFAQETGEGSGKAAVSYVGSNEYAARYAVLSDTRPAELMLYGSSSGQPGTSVPGGTKPGGTDEPDDAKPDGTGQPGTTPGTDPGSTDSSDTETEYFDPKAIPTLKLSVKSGQRRVYYKWKKVKGADGYQIFQYQKNTKKYKRLKTISDAQATQYSRNMAYGTSYQFKLRAFRTEADGSRTYGKFSKAAKITTAPSKVTGFQITKQKQKKTAKTAKFTLTWKKVSRAEGYQIFRSTKKTGTYTRMKTIPKGTAKKYTGISQKRGKKYYYKIRAYVTGADGKRRYGSFSSVKSAVSR